MANLTRSTPFGSPALEENLQRAASSLRAHGFLVEILDNVGAARTRINELIPEGANVFTAASETLRLSGIDKDLNGSGRYNALKPQLLAMDRVKEADQFRRMISCPDVIVGSVAALTETGSLVIASGSGSQLPGYAGGASHAIWIVGAQKLVRDLEEALRRVEEYCLPLESARTEQAYGRPSAINRLLILHAEPIPGRGTVLLLREEVGF